MWRTWLGISALVIGTYVIINLLVTTDLEHVESEVERLLDLAREGGPDAAAEILDALADDYHGSVSRENVERRLREYVGGKKLRSISTGSYKAVWNPDKEQILIPILMVTAELDDWTAKMILTVTCGKRDGIWKIVSIARTRWG